MALIKKTFINIKINNTGIYNNALQEASEPLLCHLLLPRLLRLQHQEPRNFQPEEINFEKKRRKIIPSYHLILIPHLVHMFLCKTLSSIWDHLMELIDSETIDAYNFKIFT